MVKAKKTQPPVDAITAIAKEYNPYLDVLKGFAILLVVLGHSLQTYVPNGQFDNNLLFRVIYSFHMPLFMFLAGAAAAYSSRRMNFDFMKRKFYMLVVPFVAWYLIGYFLGGANHTLAFKTYIHHVIDSPDYGLWFLWVLFLNFGALALVKKLEKWFKLYSYLIIWLVISALPTGKYGIGLVKWQLPFFLIGYLIFIHRQRLRNYRQAVLGVCVVVSLPLVLTWHRLADPRFITALHPRLIAHHLGGIDVGGMFDINIYGLIVQFYHYLVPLTAIGAIYWLLQLKPSKYAWKILGFFGLYTLDIYVVHEYFFRYTVGDKWWIRVIVGFVIATALSVALGIFILRRVPLLSFLFLGGRSRPKAHKLKR